MTRQGSDITVTYNGELLILDFPYNPSIVGMVNKVDGADWNERIEKKWTVPKTSYGKLVQVMGSRIQWKTPDELKQQADDLTQKEETLQEVLARVPKTIETPFMKVNPHNFQKLMIAWGVTPKGKRGQILGGLLGDTMGLGKTMQSLAFSLYLKHFPPAALQKPVKRVLIICPATLKVQWAQEIAKFTNESCQIIEGGKGKNAWKKRLDQYERVKNDDVFYTIVNYELLYQKERLGKEEVKVGWRKETKIAYGDYIDLNAILDNEYDMIVIDEAQRMRNPETETFKCISEIQTPHVRLLMTGTPVEKDLQNIFPLMDYLSPDILASKNLSFKDRYEVFKDKFLIMGYNEFAVRAARGKLKDEFLEIKGVKNIPLLKHFISPYMLRRTTEDVSDEIPDMIGHDDVILVGWDKDQRALYEVIQDEYAKLREALSKAKDEEERTKLDNDSKAMMMYLQEVADTPELLLLSDSNLAKNMLNRLNQFKNYRTKWVEIQGSNASEADKEKKISSMKRDWLMPPILEAVVDKVHTITVENEQKVVLFTKFERMTRILQREIDKKLNTANGKRKKQQVGIMMYTGKTDKSCKWKNDYEKRGEEAPGELACNACPFRNQCKSRTKSAWYFQNDPNTRVIVCNDAANYGVKWRRLNA